MNAAFGFRPDDFFFLATAISLVEGRSRRRRSVPHYFTRFQQFSEGKTQKTAPGGLRIPSGSSEVAPSRSDGASISGDAYVERVHLAIELIGSKSEGVLMVQFVGDPRECRTQIVRG